jgi:hypothetical protein
MQAYEIFILELQAARKRPRKTFELPDGCRSHLEHNGVVQSCEERPVSLPSLGNDPVESIQRGFVWQRPLSESQQSAPYSMQATKEMKTNRGQ